MLRSAAKNHAAVTVVVDPAGLRGRARRRWTRSGGATTAATQRAGSRRRSSRRPPRYDGMIADYLGDLDHSRRRALRRDRCTSALDREMRPALRREPAPARRALRRLPRVARAAPREGALLQQHRRHRLRRSRLMLDFADDRARVVAILKHNTPCGVGAGGAVLEAVPQGLSRPTPDSPFGGILIANRTLGPRSGGSGRRDLQRGADRS